MNSSLFDKATFSDWIPTGVFADIGKRIDFEKSKLLGGSSEDVPIAGVERWAGIELSPSAARLGEMQGVLIPAAKASTDVERRKFRNMGHPHLVPGRRSLMGFPAFTLEWNADLQQIKQEEVPFEPIYRKAQFHLESYWKTWVIYGLLLALPRPAGQPVAIHVSVARPEVHNVSADT